MEYQTDLLHAAATTRGLKRLENQDAYGEFSFLEPCVPGAKGHLYVVADGMGGHAAGREAAELAVRTVGSGYFADPGATPGQRLERSYATANRRVRDMAATTGNEGAGTTLTALVVIGDRAWIAHVGDSRIYRMRGTGLKKLTVDHTVVAEMVREGVIDEERASTHPQRSLLTRAVGAEPTLSVDVDGPFPIFPADRFLLCTDGMAALEPELIASTLAAHEPQMACDLLIQLANSRGGHDNTTAVLVQLSPAVHDIVETDSRRADGTR